MKQPVYPTGAEVPAEEPLEVDGVEAAEPLDSDAYTMDFATSLSDDGSILLTINSGAEAVSTVAFNLYLSLIHISPAYRPPAGCATVLTAQRFPAGQAEGKWARPEAGAEPSDSDKQLSRRRRGNGPPAPYVPFL